MLKVTKWASTQETLSSGSSFVIRLMESISKFATSEILSFYVVSVAEEAGLGMTCSETPKTGFLLSWHKCI